MSKTLTQYITDAQRLLHDSANKFYGQTELIDYVNKARKLVAADTNCTRRIASVDVLTATTLTAATYDMDTIIAGRRVMDVLDILLHYSTNTTYPLRFLPFATAVRTSLWQYQGQGTPTHYTINNRQVFILQWPGVDYLASSMDCLVEPLDLVELTDPDTDLVFPWTECVGFYVAYLAKLKNQQRQEAENFLMDYTRRVRQAFGSTVSRRLVNR